MEARVDRLERVLRNFLQVARPIGKKTADGGQLYIVPSALVEKVKKVLIEDANDKYVSRDSDDLDLDEMASELWVDP